jgi:hypothetical protein
MNRGRTITIRVKDRPNLEKILDKTCIASTGPYGNITGMRRLYWGMDALIVKYGAYLYYMGKDRGQELPF